MEKNNWHYFNEKQDPMIIGLDQELMAGLDRARHVAGIPFVILSGKRTSEENLLVGGVYDSAHLTGHAVDLRCRDSVECFKIVRALLTNGNFNRIVIGIHQDGTFHNIHVDNDSTKISTVLSIKIYKEISHGDKT